MTEYVLQDVDEMVITIADAFKAKRKQYMDGRDLFVDARDAAKANSATPNMIMAKVARQEVSDSVRKQYTELIVDFIENLGNLCEDNPGLYAVAYGDMQKDGRLNRYVLGEATTFASTVTTDVEIPTIEHLAKLAASVRGLWTSLENSASIEVLKALEVPCKVATKGATKGETWVPDIPELPKATKASDVSKIAVLKMDGEEIWRTGNATDLFAALKEHGLKFSEWETQLQLSATPTGGQQDIFTADFTWSGHHFLSEVIEPESK